MFGIKKRNLGRVSARRGGHRLLGTLTLQLDVLIRVLFGRVCRETRGLLQQGHKN